MKNSEQKRDNTKTIRNTGIRQKKKQGGNAFLHAQIRKIKKGVNMAKMCPVTGEYVLYMTCLECDDKECKNITSQISKDNATGKVEKEKNDE